MPCFFVFPRGLLRTALVLPCRPPFGEVRAYSLPITLRGIRGSGRRVPGVLPVRRVQRADVVRVGALGPIGCPLYEDMLDLNTVRLVPTPSERLAGH